MKNEWQECLRPDERKANLCISLNARGEIVMNQRTWFAFGRPWFAVLLFDPRLRRIGVRFAKPGTPNAFELTAFGSSRAARVVRARRLLKQFDIEITQTLRFRDPYLAGGIWVLDLESAFVPGKSSGHWRRKSKK